MESNAGQSRAQSFLEAVINIAIGFIINFCTQLILYPAYGFIVSPWVNFKIAMWFTVVSLIRQYILRRHFNKIMIKAGIKK